MQWSSSNCHIMLNFEPLVIVCSKATQPTSSLSQFVLRGPVVGYHLHDTLMPLKCIASTQLVIASDPRRGVLFASRPYSLFLTMP